MVSSQVILDRIALKCGTDKSSSGHDYARIYEIYFSHLRTKQISLLELGWGGYDDFNDGGESARMWRKYFTKATIKITDIHDKFNNIEGVDFYRLSQEDINMRSLGEHDIIIDDASHISSLTIASFNILWSCIKPGGWYVIEDLHSSYCPEYYGNTEADTEPNTSLFTTMQFLKSLADDVQLQQLGYNIEYVHFYNDICFIRKK